MKGNLKWRPGFTLVELLVVISVISILMALLLPVFKSTKGKARRVKCVSNLRQIDLAVRMYADDSNNAAPSSGQVLGHNALPLYAGYKELIKDYVSVRTGNGPRNPIFGCPADTFFPAFITNGPPQLGNVRQSLHGVSASSFSSYMFNGGDNVTRDFQTFKVTLPGLTGVKLTSVKHPARTVLVAEYSAAVPWSWHDPSSSLMFDGAKSMIGFVDGHVSYTRIYWNSTPHHGRTLSLALQYDPPADYEYQWSAN